MADQTYIVAKNWHTFQHYRKRNPPWIKLHTNCLFDGTISMLTNGQFGVLVRAWLLLSKNNATLQRGELGALLRRYCGPDDTPSTTNRRLKSLIDKGLILEFASRALAECYLQTETETETETERGARNRAPLSDTVTCPKPDPRPTLELVPSNGEPSKATRTKRWRARFDSHFWPPYPRKANKAAALRAYMKHQPKKYSDYAPTLKRILALLQARIDGAWAKREKELIPHASTFLNGEEFTDSEIEAATMEGFMDD